jgi:hypothetical protein
VPLEKRILRKIYRPIKENGIWRSRYNHERYKIYNAPDIVKVMKGGRLRWLGQLLRMQEQNPCRKPEGTRRVGRLAIRWLDSVEEYLKTMGFTNWRRKSQVRGQWKAIVKDSSWTLVPAEEEEGEDNSDKYSDLTAVFFNI